MRDMAIYVSELLPAEDAWAVQICSLLNFCRSWHNDILRVFFSLLGSATALTLWYFILSFGDFVPCRNTQGFNNY